jgi:hypothetical protein
MKASGTNKEEKTEGVFKFGLMAHFMKVTGRTIRRTEEVV